ncbi:hypothetical protein NQ315_007328 [Exocentrus adspersus]|uniref:Uncharacterized protein n=1 Tax=Exocentrus adspersus TaxID=1586481 RepID=A0AAV8WEN3_9CUCU|nr:hypothetical protein NQ315_007328 [Exocentrus adspersus]
MSVALSRYFRVDLHLSRSWGYKQKDGSFDGLVGALQRKQVDYGSSPLFFRSARMEVLQYGRRTWTLRAAFIFLNPKSVSSIEVFVKPLSTSMWALTIASAVLIIIVLKLNCLYEKRNVCQYTDSTWSYQYTTDVPSRELYLSKIVGKNNNSNFLAPSKGLELVEGGHYVFHVELATAYPIIRNIFHDKAICKLREVRLYRDQPMHANYQKGSPYKEMFDTWAGSTNSNRKALTDLIFVVTVREQHGDGESPRMSRPAMA